MTALWKSRALAAGVVAFVMAPALVWADDLNCPTPPADPLLEFLSPPPCDSCAEAKVEMDELRTIERNRTEAQAKHALADYEISVTRFLDGADIKFDAAAFAKCKPFFDKFSEKTKAAAEHAKDAFCRRRPYNVPGNDLKPLQTGKNSPSYPSGHATYGAAIGAVLAQMVPEKRAILYSRSADYGHSRMVAGVHYRSDVEAGKLLGLEVATEAFARDDAFRSAFPDAAKCVREALGLAPDVPKDAPQAAVEAPAPKP